MKKHKRFRSSILIVSILLASCSSGNVATQVVDWNASAVRGPMRLAFTAGRDKHQEISRIEIYDPLGSARVYARIADTTGRLFRLPPGVSATWRLVAANENSFQLQGYREETDSTEFGQHLATHSGYTEGQWLSVRSRRAEPNTTHVIDVAVQLPSGATLARSLPIALRYSERR